MTRRERQCSIAECLGSVWAREMCRKHYARWHQHGDAKIVLLNVAPAGDPQRFIDGLPESGDGCIRWPFAKNNQGYAQINIAGRKYLVTRIVCEKRCGPPPTDRHQAAHSCGKGHEACIAPWHLSWKTAAENVADAKAHGTFSHGDHHASKLTSANVREIRSMQGRASQAEIGQLFGVSQTMVSRIYCGKAWCAA